MAPPDRSELQALKRAIRAQVQGSRPSRPDQEAWSGRIWEGIRALPEYRQAQTVMAYVDVPGEVRTQPYLLGAQQQGKRIVVPYCDGEELGLFFLASLADLAPGTLGILEPRPELRRLPVRQADVACLDLLVVPGVAFDRRGARLGHGKGYFDRLLNRVRPDALLVGAAFECQLVPTVPMLPHDVYMDKVITETAVYPGKGRGSTAS